MRTGGNFEMRPSGNFALRIGGNINTNIQLNKDLLYADRMKSIPALKRPDTNNRNFGN
jgi:hypothetical protein